MKNNILITGSKGFIGKNLLQALIFQYKNYNFKTISHRSSDKSIKAELIKADYLVHLAGVNRPKKKIQFKDNYIFTDKICKHLSLINKDITIIYASTAHIDKNQKKRNKTLEQYTLSKKKAEELLIKCSQSNKVNLYIFRIPHVIGKYAKPNYNSVIATFCFNIARGISINISKENPFLEIIHIDKLINQFMDIISSRKKSSKVNILRPHQFKVRVSSIAEKLKIINNSLLKNYIYRPKNLFEKILYSTFVTYLPKNKIIQKIKTNYDKRGNFSEVFKSKDFGQISYFTSLNNIKRGNHYHNLKCEIFLVISGRAEYLSTNIFSKIKRKTILSEKSPQIIRTIPGEIHSIKKIGKKELIVLVWSNEIFNIDLPDTFS